MRYPDHLDQHEAETFMETILGEEVPAEPEEVLNDEEALAELEGETADLDPSGAGWAEIAGEVEIAGEEPSEIEETYDALPPVAEADSMPSGYIYGDEVVGWGFFDTLAAVFTGGASIPFSAAKEAMDSGKERPAAAAAAAPPEPVIPKLGPAMDIKKTGLYKKTKGKLSEAKRRRKEAEAALAAKKASRTSYTPIQSSIPSFTLNPMSFDFGTGTSGTSGETMATDQDLNVLGEQIIQEVETDPDQWVEIVGADEWDEIVGEDRDQWVNIVGVHSVGSDILVGAGVKAIKSQKKTDKTTKKTITTAKTGNVPVVVKSGKGRVSSHKKAIVRSLSTANKALKASVVAKNRANMYNPAKHKPIVVSGLAGDYEVLGAVKVPKTLTTKQKRAVERHKDAIKKVEKTVKVAKEKAAKAETKAKALAVQIKKAKPLVDKFLKARHIPMAGRTKVHGDDILGDIEEITGEDQDQWIEIIGEMIGQDEAESGDADGGAEGASGEGGTADTGGDIKMPPREQPLSKEDAKYTWRKVPEDGVVYDGSQDYPGDSFGSFNLFYGGAGGGQGDGFYWNAERKWKARRETGYTTTPRFPGADLENWKDATPEELKDISAMSAAYGWGPLIGNPEVTNGFQGIQYAFDQKKWFWLPEHAPKWATFEQDREIRKLLEQEAETKKAADEALAATAAQDQAERDEAKAKQDAANELALSAASTQEQIAQKQNAAQQLQLDLQKQQMESQLAAMKTKADLEQASQSGQLEAQQQKFQMEQAGQQRQVDRQYQLAQIEAMKGGGGGSGGGDRGGFGRGFGDGFAPTAAETSSEEGVDWGDGGGGGDFGGGGFSESQGEGESEGESEGTESTESES